MFRKPSIPHTDGKVIYLYPKFDQGELNIQRLFISIEFFKKEDMPIKAEGPSSKTKSLSPRVKN